MTTVQITGKVISLSNPKGILLGVNQVLINPGRVEFHDQKETVIITDILGTSFTLSMNKITGYTDYNNLKTDISAAMGA